jgi:hypothetical protein
MAFWAPLIAAGIGAAGTALAGRSAAKSTAAAADTSKEATIEAQRLANEGNIEVAKLGFENLLQRQQQLFDLQKEAKGLDVYKFDPSERFLTASFAASPVAQKLGRQQFYNQKALEGSLGDRLVSFGNVSRYYGV